MTDTHPDTSRGVRLRDARLVAKADFDRVFADNQRARTDYVVVMARPNQVGYPRLGMVIAKRLLARAVDRNRVKRCVRESFRQVLPELPACDFVVRLIAKPVRGDEARDLSRTFKRAGNRAMAKWPTAPVSEIAPEFSST
ncbi:MAG: ribonuclease P protein component [Thiobacillus sp.]|nr:ribonuclease P protein component [Gammaproteobacteria bacterium]OYZ30089.1 MAG: ribonuclease P protein component [Hydrogenophilales bacterium 16-64-40]OZA35344.1 MAG: ribonuclease P protein component [Hydrogenophilales bacterium 17-64-65]